MPWFGRMQSAWNAVQCSIFAMIITGSLLLTGCSSEGSPRFNVSGNVTFDGRPVPAGTIQFEPDTSRGNQGPTSRTVIKDGEYDTSIAGKGILGGPYVVVITGFDGKPIPEMELQYGKPLFTEYRTKVELPKGESIMDFTVPVNR